MSSVIRVDAVAGDLPLLKDGDAHRIFIDSHICDRLEDAGKAISVSRPNDMGEVIEPYPLAVFRLAGCAVPVAETVVFLAKVSDVLSHFILLLGA